MNPAYALIAIVIPVCATIVQQRVIALNATMSVFVKISVMVSTAIAQIVSAKVVSNATSNIQYKTR